MFWEKYYNIKFCFIGNIRPIEGYYKSLRVILPFLFDCSKIMKKILHSKKIYPKQQKVQETKKYLI